MISCNRGEIKISGSKTTIMSELACLLSAFSDADDNGHQILTEDEFAECMKLAKMSSNDIAEESKKMMKEMSPEQILRAMFRTVADM